MLQSTHIIATPADVHGVLRTLGVVQMQLVAPPTLQAPMLPSISLASSAQIVRRGNKVQEGSGTACISSCAALALSRGFSYVEWLFSLLNRINKQDHGGLLMPKIEILLLVATNAKPWDDYDFDEVVSR